MATYNDLRINRANALVAAYDGMQNIEKGAAAEQHLTDMLADLRHMAREYAIDFDRALRLSAMHFEAEISDDDENAEMEG